MNAKGLNVDTRIQNLGVLYHDENAFWKKIVSFLPFSALDGWYPFFDELGAAFRDERSSGIKRVGNSAPKEFTFDYAKKEITIHPYELLGFVPQSDIDEMASVEIDAVEDASYGLQDILNIALNKDLCALLTDTTLWASAAASVTWSTAATADPEKDIRTHRRNIIAASRGLRIPNTMAIGTLALDYLMLCNKVQERVKYTIDNRDKAMEALKGFFGIENIVEIPSAENTAAKGQTASFSQMWSNKVWLGYVERNPSKSKPSAIYACSQKGRMGNDMGLEVSTLRKMAPDFFEDGRSGVKVKVAINTNIKQVSPELGSIITSVY